MKRFHVHVRVEDLEASVKFYAVLFGAPPSVSRADYAKWMAENQIPKLFVNAEPGAILTGPVRDFCRSWKNQREVTVPGSHFIQEDSGPAIGRAVADWIKASAI